MSEEKRRYFRDFYIGDQVQVRSTGRVRIGEILRFETIGFFPEYGELPVVTQGVGGGYVFPHEEMTLFQQKKEKASV